MGVLICASAMRILILGGTTEASALAAVLAGDSRVDATMSLAGRTASPKVQPLATRIGGFGGADGLAQWIAAENVAAVIDATHPYADQISANAVGACRQAAIPLVSIVRPAWQPVSGDRWQVVASAEAAAALGHAPRRVFLSLGRLDLHTFAAAPQHSYVARIIDAPQQAELPPDIRFLQARGPFDLAAERRLLDDEKIDVVVSKNSGGTATYPKIEAARERGLPVVLIARPDKPMGHAVAGPQAAIDWLLHATPRSLRGV